MRTSLWWSQLKEQHGLARDEIILPFNRADGSVAFSNKVKAEELVSPFSSKIRVAKQLDSFSAPEPLSLCTAFMSESRVKTLTETLDTSKAVEPNGISPLLLRLFCAELSPVYNTLFNTCMKQGYWPQSWKSARVIPVHKKGTKITKKKKKKEIPTSFSVANTIEYF